MNQIGEIINTKELVCREIDIDDLMLLLKADISIYWSWGSHDEEANANNTLFRFSVQGYLHTGYVYIFLNGGDMFDVYLTNYDNEITKFNTDLYFDELVDWIDEKIEKVPEYS
jgi:hypothetical protein